MQLRMRIRMNDIRQDKIGRRENSEPRWAKEETRTEEFIVREPA